MERAKSITQMLWDRMDEILTQNMPLAKELQQARAKAELHPNNPESELRVAKLEAEKNKVGGIGRGISEALALLVAPHLADAAAVRSHALERHNAMAEGKPIETPGYVDTWIPQEYREQMPESTFKGASVPGGVIDEVAQHEVQRDEPAAPAKKAGRRKTTAAPTPEDVIGGEQPHEKVEEALPTEPTKTKMSVDEALASAAAKVAAARAAKERESEPAEPAKPAESAADSNRAAVERATKRVAEAREAAKARAAERNGKTPVAAPPADAPAPETPNVEKSPSDIASALAGLESEE